MPETRVAEHFNRLTPAEAELLAEALQQAVAWVREQEGRRG